MHVADIGPHARVAELVDALASGASVLRDVEVQVLFRAPFETCVAILYNHSVPVRALSSVG